MSFFPFKRQVYTIKKGYKKGINGKTAVNQALYLFSSGGTYLVICTVKQFIARQLTVCYMKNLIPVLIVVILTSCIRETLTAPKSLNQNITANTPVSYKDNSISIVDFKAQQDTNAINVTFTTLYEKDIARLEILRGLTANNLCSIYKQKINSDSFSPVKYNMRDQNNDSITTIYYMVKYTLANGNWGYTPVFQLSL